MLRIQGLTKTFPSPDRSGSPRRGRKTALDSISLTMAGGGILCLLGSNGAGKTTLLKILAGLVSPDSGTIELAEHDLAAAPGQAQRLTGFSPGEERSFYGRLTGLENLRFFARIRGLEDLEFNDRLQFLEAPLGLREILPTAYQKTSAGMKQKLSLARALLHDPPVLLLDEPTKSLDPAGAEKVQDFIRREATARAGRLVLWSTHRVEEAWEIGTEIAILSEARLLAKGNPAELLAQSGARSPREAFRALMAQADGREKGP